MPRIKVRDFRRNELIDATIQSIADHGLSDTTLATIADHAGVSPGLVSHYFDGKEELLAATLRRLAKDLATDIRQRTPVGVTPLQRLHAIIDGCLESQQLRPGPMLAWRAFWAILPYNPPLASLQKMINRRFASNMRVCLRQLIQDEFVNETYLGLFALIDGFWIRQFVEPESFSTSDACKVCRRYLALSISAYRKPETLAS